MTRSHTQRRYDPPSATMAGFGCTTVCLLTTLMAAQPAASNPTYVVTDEKGPCIAPEDTFDATVSGIESYGWTRTQEADDDLIEDLAWMNVVFYLNTDTGGESLDNLLEVQRKSARGLLRKKDIPQSKTRFFQNGSGADRQSLMLLWLQSYENVLQVRCRYTLRVDLEDIEPVQWPEPFVRSNQNHVGDARVQVTIFDPEQFPRHTPPNYVTHTHYQRVSK